MHALPLQMALQQSKARRISGEELEVFGKHAALQFLQGVHPTLSESVVETVKHAGLSPEQVQRVIEFTNQRAYQEEFQKEGGAHKYIHFHGGPANPSAIIQDLNDGGGGTVFDRGTSDYKSSPSFSKTAAVYNTEELEKVAMVDPVEVAYDEMFKTSGEQYPDADPTAETFVMREKLADTRDRLLSELSSYEMGYHTILEDLYGQVKVAYQEGIPLGHVVQAWSAADPAPGIVKMAFHHIGPRLRDEGVLSFDELGSSLQKISTDVANTQHPLVQSFGELCLYVEKMAAARGLLEEVVDAHSRATEFLKAAGIMSAIAKKVSGGAAKAGAEEASSVSGLVPKAWSGAKSLANKLAPGAAEAARGAGTAVFGQRAGDAIGSAAGGLVKASPYIAGGVVAKETYDRGIKYGPAQVPLQYAKSHWPGTRENYAREAMLQGYM